MIELRHLRKEFDDVTPLEDVNLTINDGDVIAVIGPSGTGKSTLLRCINMLTPPTSGDIIVNGQTITDKSCDINEVRKKMGMVFQSFNLFGHMTVIENIMNPQITLLGKSRQDAYDYAMELLHKVGLGSKALSYPDELSGGQQQRVLLARALCATQKLIVLDEPVSGLDPHVTMEMYGLIRDLNREDGITVMMISHDITAALQEATHILHVGEDLFFGTKADYLASPLAARFLALKGGEPV